MYVYFPVTSYRLHEKILEYPTPHTAAPSWMIFRARGLPTVKVRMKIQLEFHSVNEESKRQGIQTKGCSSRLC